MKKIFTILFFCFCNLFFTINSSLTEEIKVRIGLLVPLSGDNAEIGKQIVKATRLALKDINSENLEIFPKDTQSDPKKTLRSAVELEKLGIQTNSEGDKLVFSMEQDKGNLFQKAQEMMSNMSDEQRNELFSRFQNMSEEEKAVLYEQGKKMGLI